MKRKITIEEVKHFLECANKQFEEAGIYLINVKFIRNSEGITSDIDIHYHEVPIADERK